MKKIKVCLLITSVCTILISCSSKSKTQSKNEQTVSDTSSQYSDKQVIIHHQFKVFPKGQVINHIACLHDAAQTFCLYLPKDYDTNMAWPVIYFFDAHARGKLPVTKYKELAEKFHLIVVGSNNSQNGLAPEAYDRIVNNLFSTTQIQLNISTNKIITAGFSGGGKVAAGIALKNSSVTSVISCGAGLEMDHLGSSYFNYVSIVGKGDFNYWDMIEIDQQLNSTPLKHLLLTFDGIHEWPDVETMSTAIDFASNPNKKISSSMYDPSLAQKEQEIRMKYSKDFQSQDAMYWLDIISKLNDGFKDSKSAEKWMDRRLLSFINMMTYIRLSGLLQNNQLDAARPYLMVFKSSDPKNPDGEYLTADWYALKGDKQGAISSLSEAMKLGYDDFAHFSTDPMLASIQNEMEYQNVYKILSN